MRKIKIEYVDIDRLKMWENNPRINDEASKKLSKLIEYYGFINPIIATPDGVIRAGHTRYKAAKLNKLKKVPVIFIDFKSEKKARGFSISDNKSYEFSEWNIPILKDLLEELDIGEFDVSLTGFEENEIEDLMTQFHIDKPEEDDFDVDKAVEEIKKPICKIGDLWQLGEHRLMCGDSRKKEDIERLINVGKVNMVFTDPPYGIDYQDLKKRFNKIINDKESDTPKILKSIIRFGDIPYYICCNWQSYPLFFMILKDLIDIKALIVWDKKRGVQNLDKYYKRHEFIIYSGAFGGEETLDGDIWELNREISELHPNQKPVELCGKAINNSSKINDIVLDLFGGSGSTLITCEKLNRICYMMEIEPLYCDVIIKRWEQYTNRKAVMIN
jgi:DNA modification methylase